jgi:hypothetical protein
MAVLSDSDRLDVWANMLRTAKIPGLLKADVRAAIDAADTWADANAASFNAALPQPAKSVLTAQQKAQLLFYVIQKRYQVS